ncbi:hypothetical protein N657DRAFT_175433 [Parathielavia appendiculata]|uniref:Uncharacterized protein n=1 Tax=Parathielavia appendiculata TaxID=2587402 RepID=A0AAN6U5F6_9PEZI|nr:hypothetical protein N657DRAFT_175433 [Parathielavia appendiculata]
MVTTIPRNTLTPSSCFMAAAAPGKSLPKNCLNQNCPTETHCKNSSQLGDGSFLRSPSFGALLSRRQCRPEFEAHSLTDVTKRQDLQIAGIHDSVQYLARLLEKETRSWEAQLTGLRWAASIREARLQCGRCSTQATATSPNDWEVSWAQVPGSPSPMAFSGISTDDTSWETTIKSVSRCIREGDDGFRKAGSAPAWHF